MRGLIGSRRRRAVHGSTPSAPTRPSYRVVRQYRSVARVQPSSLRAEVVDEGSGSSTDAMLEASA
eukprot:6789417-Prymnesium_polylepis.1